MNQDINKDIDGVNKTSSAIEKILESMLYKSSDLTDKQKKDLSKALDNILKQQIDIINMLGK